ncbi:MAG: SAP domain-containing protein [Acidobacteriota bacterium]
MSLEELQAECTKLGLTTAGEQAELVERLQTKSIEKMKKAALEAECRNRGLATDGGVKPLRKRLLEALAAARQATGTNEQPLPAEDDQADG